MLKYVCVVFCMLNELLLNEIRFKYWVRILDFVKVLFSVSVIWIL